MRQDLGQDWARIYAAHACAAIVAVGPPFIALPTDEASAWPNGAKSALATSGLQSSWSPCCCSQAPRRGDGAQSGWRPNYSDIPSLLYAAEGFLWLLVWHRRLAVRCHRGGLATASGSAIARHRRGKRPVRRARNLSVRAAVALPIEPSVALDLVSDVPSGRDGASKSEDTFPRAILCLVAAWQGLQAYPVAGSQVAIGTFLFIPVYSLCLYDAIATFTRELSALRHRPRLSPQTGLLLKGLVFANLVYLLAANGARPAVVGAITPRCRHWICPAPITFIFPLTKPTPTGNSRTTSNVNVTPSSLGPACTASISEPGRRPRTYFRTSSEVVAALRRAKRPLIVINDRRILINERNTQSPESTGPINDDPLIAFVDDTFGEVKRLGTFRILAPNR